MTMRSLPLTSTSKPGGRPRATRAPANAFAEWLVGCEFTPDALAMELKISISSVYNLRNGYFAPGRELANKIAVLTNGKVPSSSWDMTKVRKRKIVVKAKRVRRPAKAKPALKEAA